MTNATARLARITEDLKNNRARLEAFARQERETLKELRGFAAFNGGPSKDLAEASEAFESFCRVNGLK
jgi:hypothetical protein